jgi:hypothetical protein
MEKNMSGVLALLNISKEMKIFCSYKNMSMIVTSCEQDILESYQKMIKVDLGEFICSNLL